MTNTHPPTACLPFPLELRQQIYAHLFTGFSLYFGPGRLKECHSWASRFAPSPRSIFLVSKQTRSEAINILHQVVSINFGFPTYAYKPASYWTSQLSEYGPQRDSLRYQASWEEVKGDRRVNGMDSVVDIEQSFNVTKGSNLFGNCGRITLTTLSSSSWAIELHIKDRVVISNLRFEFRLDGSKEIDLDDYELGYALVERHGGGKAHLVFFQKALSSDLEEEAS